MFRPIEPPDPQSRITLLVGAQEIEARRGDSVAMALLNAGIGRFRTTPVSHAPRAPFCMMGVCFDCLIAVNGQPNVQACMVEVQPGMRIELQDGARRLEDAA